MAEWLVQPELVEPDPLAPDNVFAILAHHYSPQHATVGVPPTDRLSAILPADVYDHVDETVGLNTAMERLHEVLVRELGGS